MHPQAVGGSFMWAVFVVLTITSRTTINAENATTVSNPNHDISDMPRLHTFHKYIILYKDADNEKNFIDCTPPVNITLSHEDEEALSQWTGPNGVPLVTSVHDNGQWDDSEDKEGQGMTWVELTSSRTLVFHNPDDSVAGRYVCHNKPQDQIAYQVTVWVHVTEKNVFNTLERLKVGFITTIIFLGFVVVIYGAYRWHRRRRVQYSVAKIYDDHDINIPTINVSHVTRDDFIKIQA